MTFPGHLERLFVFVASPGHVVTCKCTGRPSLGSGRDLGGHALDMLHGQRVAARRCACARLCVLLSATTAPLRSRTRNPVHSGFRTLPVSLLPGCVPSSRLANTLCVRRCALRRRGGRGLAVAARQPAGLFTSRNRRPDKGGGVEFRAAGLYAMFFFFFSARHGRQHAFSGCAGVCR